MSGTTQDFSGVRNTLQDIVKAQYALQQQLAKGLAINTSVPSYTVAGLPAAAPVGVVAYASNGRGPSEGAGVGTGTLVVGNGIIWRAVWSGLQVTV
jgi:hypothetical protein